ncbi:MAG: membrane protein insertase YidC [Verrucomicrobiota bacterium]
MDRTSLIGAITCAILFVAISFYIEANYRPTETPSEAAAQQAGAEPNVGEQARPPGAPAPPDAPQTAATATDPGADLGMTAAPKTAVEQARDELPAAQEVTLENDELTAVFTTHGGAIQHVDLKEHPDEGDQLVRLNTGAREPVLNLFGWEGAQLLVGYELVRHDEREVVFRHTYGNGVELTRRYTLGDRYQIFLEQTARNVGSDSVKTGSFRLNLGTEGPVHEQDVDRLIGAAWLTADGGFHKISVLDFLPGGLFGFQWSEARSNISTEPDEAPLQWAAVNNQFYVLLLTPPEDEGILRVDVQPRTLPRWQGKGDHIAKAAQAEAWMPSLSLEPNATHTSAYMLYAGPKEYNILNQFDRRQKLIMDFGWFGWIIVPLLWSMTIIHDLFFSQLAWGWGWTIILLTIIIKGILWPLQSVANRNMKRMQQLHPKIEEIRQKYKDNPQKMNEEVFGIYKDYGINPAGGCLPILVQMPIFIGFYIMLQSAVELRGESFLWIHDLTQPDTVAHLPTAAILGFDFPINPLPVIMTISTVVLMQMNPAAMDNPQMRMFKWLPVIFLVVLYTFAAALPLYWTVNNIIQGIQTYINLRKPLPELKKKERPRTPQRQK